MSGFNGAGTFVRAYNWVNDKNNAINITASRMDGDSDNFATGLSTCICKDGQQTTTANIPFAVGLSVNAGTAGTPAIKVIGDTTTGLYQTAAGALDVSISGTRAGGFTSTGLNNTVIGATTPVAGSFTTVTASTPIAVAQGGTGRATGTTAYGVVCVGTTATGAQQTTASAGTAGQPLVSAGAAALPAYADYPAASTSWAGGLGYTGFSSNPSGTSATYQKIGKICFIYLAITGFGTSNANTFTITGLPFTSAGTVVWNRGVGADNGTNVGVTLMIASGGTTITCCKGEGTAANTWTTSGNKGAEFSFFYETV